MKLYPVPQGDFKGVIPEWLKQTKPDGGRFYFSKMHEGRRREKSLGIAADTVAKAIKRGEKVLADLVNPAPTQAERLAEFRTRCEDMATEVIASKKLRAPRTLASAEQHFDLHLVPWWNANAPYIQDANSRKIWEQYIAEKRAVAPDMRFLNHHKHWVMMLKHAEEEGHLKDADGRPLKRVKLKNPDPDPEAGKSYSDDEVSRLLANSNPDLKDAILIALHTGMRRSEILLLEWDRVDFEASTLTLKRLNTKTRKKRDVPLNADVIEILKARRERVEGPWVFPSRKGGKTPTLDNKTAWQACKRAADVTGRFHDLRHTCITNLLNAGMPPLKVAKYVGASWTVIDKIYEHLNAKDLKEVANANAGKFRESQ